MKFLKHWLHFIVFLFVCFLFGRFSLLIRWQNIALVGMLVVAIVFSRVMGDITQGMNNSEIEE